MPSDIACAPPDHVDHPDARYWIRKFLLQFGMDSSADNPHVRRFHVTMIPNQPQRQLLICMISPLFIIHTRTFHMDFCSVPNTLQIREVHAGVLWRPRSGKKDRSVHSVHVTLQIPTEVSACKGSGQDVDESLHHTVHTMLHPCQTPACAGAIHSQKGAETQPCQGGCLP